MKNPWNYLVLRKLLARHCMLFSWFHFGWKIKLERLVWIENKTSAVDLLEERICLRFCLGLLQTTLSEAKRRSQSRATYYGHIWYITTTHISLSIDFRHIFPRMLCYRVSRKAGLLSFIHTFLCTSQKLLNILIGIFHIKEHPNTYQNYYKCYMKNKSYNV